MERLLSYVFAGTRGGPTRVRIMLALLDGPRNANQLARGLGLDYKTVEYNLRVLQKHVLVVCRQPGTYGAPFFPSKNLLAARPEFDRIAESLRSPKPDTSQLGKATSTDASGETPR